MGYIEGWKKRVQKKVCKTNKRDKETDITWVNPAWK